METRKLYYSIGEVASILDVKSSQIRHWEKEIKILNPKKQSNGARAFTTKDIENLRLIIHLVKDLGYTLPGANKKLMKSGKATMDNFNMIQRLKKIKSFLVDMKSQKNQAKAAVNQAHMQNVAQQSSAEQTVAKQTIVQRSVAQQSVVKTNVSHNVPTVQHEIVKQKLQAEELIVPPKHL